MFIFLPKVKSKSLLNTVVSFYRTIAQLNKLIIEVNDVMFDTICSSVNKKKKKIANSHVDY